MQIFPNVFVFVSGDARCEIKPFVMLNFLLYFNQVLELYDFMIIFTIRF